MHPFPVHELFNVVSWSQEAGQKRERKKKTEKERDREKERERERNGEHFGRVIPKRKEKGSQAKR